MPEETIDRPMIVRNDPEVVEIERDLYARLAAAQAEIVHAEHDRSNPMFRSRYASLAAIVTAVREPLTNHGLALTMNVSVDTESSLVTVEARIYHGGDYASSGPVTLPVTKAQRGKGPVRCTPEQLNAQAIGAAITYARRQAIQLVVGLLASDEDKDGNPLVVGESQDDDLDLTADEEAALDDIRIGGDDGEEIVL